MPLLLPITVMRTTNREIGMVMEQESLVEIAIEYFKKVDAGDPSYLDLFSENVDFSSPNLVRLKERMHWLSLAIELVARSPASGTT